MRILIPHCFLPLLCLVSCKLESVDADSETQKATIVGNMQLGSDYFTTLPPFDGIRVSLDGTSLSTLTDSAGDYKLSDVPAGTYDVRFSKPGFGDVIYYENIVGGGNRPFFISPKFSARLFRFPDLVTRLEHGHFQDSTVGYFGGRQSFLILEGRYTTNRSHLFDAMNVYVSHSPSVSAVEGQYETFSHLEAIAGEVGSSFDSVAGTFRFPFRLSQLLSLGFKSGDSIYVSAYGAPVYGATPEFEATDRFDPTNPAPITTATNRTPSLVLGLKVP